MNKRKPLIVFLAIVALLCAFFEWYTPSRDQDRALLVFIGMLYTVCVVLMLLYAPEWHIRALGVFGVVSGTVLLYFYLGRPHDGWIPGYSIPTSLIRAFFVVGGITLLLSQVLFVREKRRGQSGDLVDA